MLFRALTLAATAAATLATSLPALAEGEFYIEDLAGMDVIDENGEPAGKVMEVHNFGAGDLLEIQPPSGGDTYFLAFNDETVSDVNMNKKSIHVTTLET